MNKRTVENWIFSKLPLKVALVVIILFVIGYAYLNMQNTTLHWLEQFTNIAIPTFIAAWAGAIAAFKMERAHRARAERNMRVSAGNLALFTLYQLHYALFHFQRDVINRVRATEDRWYEMYSVIPGMIEKGHFEIAELRFLLDDQSPHADAANMLTELVNQERLFNIAVGLIQLRSEVILNELNPQIPTIASDGQITSLIKTRLPHVHHKLYELTDQIIERVDDSVRSTEQTYNQLKQTLTKIFPDARFVDISFLHHPNTNTIAQ